MEGSERPWDAVFEGFSSNADLWAAGGGDTTDHILPADGMFAGGVRLPFVRVLKDGKDGPASADNGNSSSSPVKKEEGKSSSAAAASAASEISPKKHGKRVRETWKVSPKSEDKTSSISHAAVAASTNSNCNSSSSSNTSNSSSANNSCDTTPPSSSSQSNNLKVKSEEEPLSAVKTEGNDESKGENEEAVEKPDVIEALKASTGILVVDPTNARRRLEKKVLEEENYQPDQVKNELSLESKCRIYVFLPISLAYKATSRNKITFATCFLIAMASGEERALNQVYLIFFCFYGTVLLKFKPIRQATHDLKCYFRPR